MKMKWEELYKAWLDKNRDAIVRTEELADSAVSEERVKKNIAVWHKTENGIAYRIVHAWVFNPNTEREEAYWEGGEPVLATTTAATATFRDEVIKTLNAMKEKGEIVAFRLDAVDESTKTAIAFTYTQTTEGIKEERVLITEKEGEISVERIV